MIRLEFYGVLAEAAGRATMEYPLPTDAEIAAVLSELQRELPALARHLPRVACAVDDRIVPRSHRLVAGATLALLPPVSGG